MIDSGCKSDTQLGGGDVRFGVTWPGGVAPV